VDASGARFLKKVRDGKGSTTFNELTANFQN